MKEKEVLKCKVCGKELIGRQKMYCSKKCKDKYLHDTKYHTKYSKNQDNKGLLRKLLLIKERGNKCEKCGYNKNITALEFHHLKDKQFTLDIRNLGRKSIDVIKEEVNKCLLLCSNCHQELHHPEYSIEEMEKMLESYNIDSLTIEKTKNVNDINVNLKKTLQKHYCIDCGKEITRSAKLRCKECSDREARKTEWPEKDVLLQLVLTTPMTKIGEQYGVSDNAVRKWCKHYNIPSTKKEIKEYLENSL